MSRTAKEIIRVAIYCRISLARHGDQVKVERQEQDCRVLAERRGWEVVEVFVDNSKSAWQRNRKRPGWDALLEGVDAGLFDAIVVYHGDRLIRQPWDLELLLRLADEKGLRLASPTGTRDLDNPEDRFILRIEAAHACRESDNISRRTKRAHESRANKGIPHQGGSRPFGYEANRVDVCEGEAAIYRDLVARLIAGESLTSLLHDLNGRGILTTTGKRWGYSALRLMITRPRYAGLMVYRGEIVGEAPWKPLIERDTWEALLAQVGKNAERYTYGSFVGGTRRHLLSGIAVCGSCGQPLSIFHQGHEGKWTTYGCVNHDCTGKVRRSKAHLDEYVTGRVLRRLADPRLWERIYAAPADDGAGAELEALEVRKRQVVAEFAEDDEMDPALLRGMLRRLDERIAAARGRIASRRASHVLDGCRDLSREGWDALPLDRRRAIVRELLTVTVLPSRKGPGFDKASVRAEPVEAM